MSEVGQVNVARRQLDLFGSGDVSHPFSGWPFPSIPGRKRRLFYHLFPGRWSSDWISRWTRFVIIGRCAVIRRGSDFDAGYHLPYWRFA